MNLSNVRMITTYSPERDELVLHFERDANLTVIEVSEADDGSESGARILCGFGPRSELISINILGASAICRHEALLRPGSITMSFPSDYEAGGETDFVEIWFPGSAPCATPEHVVVPKYTPGSHIVFTFSEEWILGDIEIGGASRLLK